MKRRHTKMPIWVAKVHEVVHHNGKRYANVTTKTGKPRTIRLKP